MSLFRLEPTTLQAANGSCRVVVVRGALDLEAAPALKIELAALVKSGVRRLIVELSADGQVDSSGLSVLVGAQRRMSRAGGALVVVFDDQYLGDKLAALGLDRVLTLARTRDQALSGLGVAG